MCSLHKSPLRDANHQGHDPRRYPLSDSQTTVPYGYCECGCGQKTTVPKHNSPSRNVVKGKPRRFIHGHNRRRFGCLEKDCGYETPCWLWQGYVDKRTGYPYMTVESKSWRSHRWFYEQLVGPIPEGLTLDHLCRVRHCVNPDHMDPCPAGENAMRGNNWSAKNARKTHCVNGHEFTEENTYRRIGSNHRVCRTCCRDRSRRARERKRDALSVG